MNKQALIHDLYRAFNSHDTDFLLERMTPDVHWPNGWEGGYVESREGVREYWTRQWAEINPTVTPIGVDELPDGSAAVRVLQRVEDHAGKRLHEGEVMHTYRFRDGLVSEMEIGETA
jgi:ketosteroid isomerase-like protein